MDGIKNTALSPLFVTMAGGMVFVVAYSVRSQTRNSDFTWNNEETPQIVLLGKQYEMFNPKGIEFDKLQKSPEY